MTTTPTTVPLTAELRAYWHGVLEGKSGWDAQDLALAAALDELDARDKEHAENEAFFDLENLTDEQFAEQCRARGHDPATFPEVVEAGAEASWKTMRVFVQTACEKREALAMAEGLNLRIRQLEEDVERWAARNRELEERLKQIVHLASGRGR